jgi:hypothetical protein
MLALTYQCCLSMPVRTMTDHGKPDTTATIQYCLSVTTGYTAGCRFTADRLFNRR